MNWCPALGTVLANEEVIDGRSERGGHPVVRRPMKQWMLRITDYAERLLDDLDNLDWPDSIKEMQRNWIGRSEGVRLSFRLPGAEEKVEVFTTRPDTLLGVTYLVLAPEHPLIHTLTSNEQAAAVRGYVETASRKSDLERTDLAKRENWDFHRCLCDASTYRRGNPNMGCGLCTWNLWDRCYHGSAAHDERDNEFAAAFELPVIQVVTPPDGDCACYTGDGFMQNSACEKLDVNGMTNSDAGQKISEWLEENSVGTKTINYKLRDWLFARQRYWGEPFPVVYADNDPDTPVPIPYSDLPLTLPETDSFKPSGTGEGPLANIAEWVNTVDPRDGVSAARGTQTQCPNGQVRVGTICASSIP